VVRSAELETEIADFVDHNLMQYRVAVTKIPRDEESIRELRQGLEDVLDRAKLLDAAVATYTDQLDKRNTAREASSSVWSKSCYTNQSAQCVFPGLYLGSFHVAANKDELLEMKVTHICCCIDVAPRFPGEFEFMNIPADDSPSFDMSKYFESTFRFIDGALRSGGTVFVHCGAGISRAPTVLAAYLIRKLGISDIRAIEFIKRARPSARPNTGFVRQLAEYSKAINE